jgi:Na+/H+-dicarboxylate symporter
MKEGTRVLVALAAGLAAGIAVAASHNAALISAADAIAAVGTLWVNAIRMTVIPLVVALLITGVASASDISTIGHVGRRTVAVFMALLAGGAALAIPLGILAFSWLSRLVAERPALPPGAADAAKSVAAGAPAVSVSSWLLSLIPTNPVGAAATGDMLPLIVFTLLLALAIARSATKTREMLLGFFGALSEAMLVLVRWIIWLAPAGVFALMVSLGAHAGAGLAGALGFYIAAYSFASVLFTVLLYPVIALTAGIPVRDYAAALFPAQLIAFSSSSSIAALPALVEGADARLHLPKDVSGFVLPLSVAMFKFAAPVSWTFGTLFVAWFYQHELHGAQYAVVAFASTFLAFAAPGVPRGAFLMLAPLFLAIGLPVEGIGMLIAVDAIPDLFATVLNASGDMAAAALVAAPALRGRRTAAVVTSETTRTIA